MTTENVTETLKRMARDLGKVLGVPVKLPLTVELVNLAEWLDDDDPDCRGSALVLTMPNKNGGPCYLTAVTAPSQCSATAKIQQEAFRCFLATPQGQEAALAFLEHSFDLHEMWNWPDCGSPCADTLPVK